MSTILNIKMAEAYVPSVSLNTGVITRSIERGNDSRKCYFPRDDWYALDNNDLLVGKSKKPVLSLMGPSLEVYEFFWREIYPVVFDEKTKDKSDERRSVMLDQFSEYIAKVLAAEMSLHCESVRSCDVIINPPGMNTTAFDYKYNEYLGLHIDNHEHFPLQDREKSFQVIGINLGRSPRYIQFIPLDVLEILARLNLSPDGETNERFYRIRHLTDLFFSTFPDTPVVRVEIPPGHSYMTVTQNVIHDGATYDGDDFDVSCLLGGLFTQATNISS